MASVAGPRTVEDGLILHLDAANPRSYRGPTAVNLVSTIAPGGIINSYPMTGNAWGTFQVNQYNNAQYFSIGGIDNITNNIVSMTGPHVLRTFDAVRPQTTGGGVTAGIDYYVKKVSATGFSLHSYSSSQNGTLGFSVLDPIFNDQRIGLTSTNFPTMWWGSPHLPNSDTIKTILPRGFDFEGRVHDCVRINWFRTDGVGIITTKGGMAYGVNPTIPAGTTCTWSFYHKAGNAKSSGQTGIFQVYFSSNASSRFTTYIPGTQWKRHSFSAQSPGITTSSILMYWFPGNNLTVTGNLCHDISEIQVELGGNPTPSVPTSRGWTAGSGGGVRGLGENQYEMDLTGITGYTASSGGGIVFDSSRSSLLTPIPMTASSVSALSPFSFSMWLKPIRPTPQGVTANGVLIGAMYYSGASLYWNVDSPGITMNARAIIRDEAGTRQTSSVPLVMGSTYNLVLVNSRSDTKVKFYVNGSLHGEVQGPTSNYRADLVPTAGNIGINKPQIFGGGTDTYTYFDGVVYSASIYSKELSAAEVKQNFNAMRKRFGI